MKKKLIAGNWKMNGSLAANEALVAALVTGLKTAAPIVHWWLSARLRFTCLRFKA